MEKSKVSSVGSRYEIEVEGGKDNYPFNSKTFWIGIVCIALGIYLAITDDKNTGTQLILLGLGLLGIRDAIRKVDRKL